MANIKSAEKRILITRVRAQRNAAYKSMMKTAVRRYETALKGGDTDEAKQALIKAVKMIDKIASKGVIHKNTAGRKKSRLSKRLSVLTR
jgi:small subunit ribosomal protein S20